MVLYYLSIGVLVAEPIYPTTGWEFSRTPIRIRRPPVRFGGDNEYVYKDLLGVSDEEYAQLVKEGHISTEPSADIS